MNLFTRAVKFFFSGPFSFIASLASVIGLIIIVFTQENAAYISLCAIIIFLVIILIKFFSVVNKFILQKTENGYHKFATYVRYSTDDGKHIVYELHKYIQCKTIIMNEHHHNFFWSGSCDPKYLHHYKISLSL